MRAFLRLALHRCRWTFAFAMIGAGAACEVLPDGGQRTLGGTVTDRDGLRGGPVAAANVFVLDRSGEEEFDEDDPFRPRQAPSPDAVVGSTVTAADGSFVLDGLPAGRFDLVVQHDDYFESNERVSLTAGSGDVEVPLEAFLFDIRIRGWSTTDFVLTSLGSNFGFRAGEGFVWLEVEVEVESLSRNEEVLDAFSDGFSFITTDGLTYSDRLQANRPEGALLGRVPPRGEVRGHIWFEVPEAEDPTGGHLVPFLEQGPTGLPIEFTSEMRP